MKQLSVISNELFLSAIDLLMYVRNSLNTGLLIILCLFFGVHNSIVTQSSAISE